MGDEIVLDGLDRRILGVLQDRGRITYDELAGTVGLSASAVLRRVKRLEDCGVIAGYVTLVDAERVGLRLTAYLNVRLAKHSEQGSPVEGFGAAVQGWPEVVDCVALSGDTDYLLRVLVRDMPHYSHFILDVLLKHPAVQDCKTSFMMRRLKGTTAVPI